jgi:hypothetical protein
MSQASERLRLLNWAALLLFVAFGAVYVSTLDFTHAIPRDSKVHVVGRDFLNFWMYGRAAFEANPGQYYDLKTYWAAADAITGPGYPPQLWSYPPSVMLLAAPFGAPPAIFGLVSGQFHYLATAAILAVLRWRESRPLLAGIILGLLTIKPQIGLFFPILLLATRSWRVILVASATASAVAGLTALVWGVDVWLAYLGEGLGNQTLVLTDPDNLSEQWMATPFINARSAGLPIAGAWVVQAAATILAVALVWKTFSRRPGADDLRANAIFLACATFGTPYMMSYDTLPLVVAMLLLMPIDPVGRLLTLLAWGLQLLQFAFGVLHLPGPALIPIAIAFYLVKQPASSTWVDQRNWPTGRTQESA